MTYDADNWLVSLHRTLGKYIGDTLADPDTVVEMDFPDTASMEKQNPLPKALIHLVQDDEDDPVLGFGVPGVYVNDDTDPDNPTVKLHEAARHDINFDVGVWVSAAQGGATKRMELVQALKNMLSTATGRQALNEATDGITVVSFNGGRNQLDRINDVPVWRAMDMTLIVRVFSRHIPATAVPVPTVGVGENLTIATGVDGDGETVLSPVETP